MTVKIDGKFGLKDLPSVELENNVRLDDTDGKLEVVTGGQVQMTVDVDGTVTVPGDLNTDLKAEQLTGTIDNARLPLAIAVDSINANSITVDGAAIDPTVGVLTKSFVQDEEFVLPLLKPTDNAIVHAQKEFAGDTVTESFFNTNADRQLFDFRDYADNADITLSDTTGRITITKSVGLWATEDINRTIEAGSGIATIESIDGDVATANVRSDFTDTSFSGGEWKLVELNIDSGKIELSSFFKGGGDERPVIDPILGNVSDAIFNEVLFIGNQADGSTGLEFSTDGTKLFIIDNFTDIVHQYSLATSFNLTGASYDNISFSAASQDTSIRGISFSNDGSKMFICGDSSQSVHQYNLPTSFDLTGASFDNVSFSFSSQDNVPQEIIFSPDGLKLFMVGSNTDRVYQYSLATPFRLNDASYDGISFLVNQDNLPNGIAFSPDGLKLYMIGEGTPRIHQYSLQTPFRLSGASYDNISISVDAQDSFPHGIVLSPDGSKVFTIGAQKDNVNQYNLPTGFDVSSEDSLVQDIALSKDGSKMFIVGANTDRVHQYSLTNPFNTNEASYDGVSLSIGAQDSSPSGIVFSSDGSKVFIIGNASDSVHQYSLPTPFRLNGASFDNVSFSVAQQDATPSAISFSEDGSKMFMVGTTSDRVHQYSLTNPFNLSEVSYDNISFDVSGQESVPLGLSFSSDGLRLFIVGSNDNTIYQYNLSTPFSIEQVSFNNISFSVSIQDSDTRGIAFSDDGTKLFVAGNSTDSVYQYDTAVPFRLEGLIQNYISGKYVSAITNISGQIVTQTWADINELQILDSDIGEAYYAFSTDNKQSFFINSTNGTRKIVRNNNGTFEFNQSTEFSSEDFVSSSENNVFSALEDAASVSTNRNNSSAINNLLDEQIFNTAETLDFAIILRTDDIGATPTFDKLDINYQLLGGFRGAIHGIDYDYKQLNQNSVVIESLKDNNLKIRVL